MYKLDIKPDFKEAAAVERRRALEEARKARIFNPKFRQIGIEVDTLEQQVKDKKQMEEREKFRSEAYASDMKRNDEISLLLQQREEADRKRFNMSLNEFRAMHQNPESRREWDLYDPEALRKDKPARVSDEDPRCTLSGLQKFEGEDWNRKAREKFQKEQNETWWNIQKNERDIVNHRQKSADQMYDHKMKELDQRATELALAEESCRRAIKMANDDYNKALQRENEHNKNLEATQEENDKLTEIANMVYGDFLTENPAQGASLLGPHRINVQSYKGMSQVELEAIRQCQAAQREERERSKMEEKLEQEEWDRLRVAHARAATLMERESARFRKTLDNQLANENFRLADEQKQHRDFLDTQVYTNAPTSSYFTQFNTTTR